MDTDPPANPRPRSAKSFDRTLRGAAQLALSGWKRAAKDNIGLIAAGVAFYGFLALVPLLGAVVIVYGLVVTPAQVLHDIGRIASMVPADAANLIGQQMLAAVHSSAGKKGLGLAVALGVSLFGARTGAGAIITALNVAYEELEKRSFIIVNLLAIAITVGAMLAVLLLGATLGTMTNLGHFVAGLPWFVLTIIRWLSYVILFFAGAAGAAVLYRFGPSRSDVKWIWLTPGSTFAALSWLLISLLFGVYVAHIGNYGATYGALSAVVVLMTWLFLSSYALLLGAELNAVLEMRGAQAKTLAPEPTDDRSAARSPPAVPTEAPSKLVDTVGVALSVLSLAAMAFRMGEGD